MATSKKATGPVINLVKGVNGNFRQGTARAAYWEAIQAFNGKPVSAFTAHCQANPPSTPQRGKLAGKPEPTAGWVRWFARNGYITIS